MKYSVTLLLCLISSVALAADRQFASESGYMNVADDSREYTTDAGFFNNETSLLVAGVLSEVGHTHNTVTLGWTAATGAVPSYTDGMEYSPGGEDDWAATTSGSDNPGTVDNADTHGIVPETEYDFRVRFDDDDETVYSNVVTVTTDAAPGGGSVVFPQGLMIQ